MIDNKRVIYGTETVIFSHEEDNIPLLLRQAADLLEKEGGCLISIVYTNELSEPPRRGEEGLTWALSNGLQYREQITVTYTPD